MRRNSKRTPTLHGLLPPSLLTRSGSAFVGTGCLFPGSLWAETRPPSGETSSPTRQLSMADTSLPSSPSGDIAHAHLVQSPVPASPGVPPISVPAPDVATPVSTEKVPADPLPMVPLPLEVEKAKPAPEVQKKSRGHSKVSSVDTQPHTACTVAGTLLLRFRRARGRVPARHTPADE